MTKNELQVPTKENVIKGIKAEIISRLVNIDCISDNPNIRHWYERLKMGGTG